MCAVHVKTVFLWFICTLAHLFHVRISYRIYSFVFHLLAYLFQQLLQMFQTSEISFRIWSFLAARHPSHSKHVCILPYTVDALSLTRNCPLYGVMPKVLCYHLRTVTSEVDNFLYSKRVMPRNGVTIKIRYRMHCFADPSCITVFSW